MDNSGWIKLHRKLRDNPHMRKPAYRSVWIEFLLEAEFQKGKSVLMSGSQYYLRPGEFTCGLNQLSLWTGVPKGTCERIVKTFENETMIETQKTNQFTLYRLKNWDMYQNIETQNETPVRLRRDSGETPVRTPKEYKNIRKKEEKNIGEKEFSHTPLMGLIDSLKTGDERIEVLVAEIEKKGFDRDIILEELHKFISYWTEASVKGKQRWQGEKYFDLKRRLATWFTNVRNKGVSSIPTF